jgi:acylphosphatase
MAQERRRVVIYGEVQGVSFRDATARRARERGVAGSVRNRDDGAVEAIFEGPGEAVEVLVDWSGRGPSLARVSRVEVEEEQPEGLSDFEIVG